MQRGCASWKAGILGCFCLGIWLTLTLPLQAETAEASPPSNPVSAVRDTVDSTDPSDTGPESVKRRVFDAALWVDASAPEADYARGLAVLLNQQWLRDPRRSTAPLRHVEDIWAKQDFASPMPALDPDAVRQLAEAVNTRTLALVRLKRLASGWRASLRVYAAATGDNRLSIVSHTPSLASLATQLSHYLLVLDELPAPPTHGDRDFGDRSVARLGRAFTELRAGKTIPALDALLDLRDQGVPLSRWARYRLPALIDATATKGKRVRAAHLDARLLDLQGADDEAEKLYRRALKKKRKDAAAMGHLIALQIRQGKIKAAKPWLLRFEKSRHDPALAHRLWALYYRDPLHAASRLRQLKQAAKQKSPDPWVYRQLAEAYLTERSLLEVSDAYEAAARVCTAQEDYPNAAGYLLRARLAGGPPELLDRIALDRLTPAQLPLMKAVIARHVGGDSFGISCLRARIATLEGHLDEAGYYCREAIIDPGLSPRVALMAGKILFYLNDYKEAARVFARVPASDIHYPAARRGLAWSLVRQGEYEAGLSTFLKGGERPDAAVDPTAPAAPANPADSTDRLLDLARMERECGRAQDLRKSLAKLDRACPGDPQVLAEWLLADISANLFNAQDTRLADLRRRDVRLYAIVQSLLTQRLESGRTVHVGPITDFQPGETFPELLALMGGPRELSDMLPPKDGNMTILDQASLPQTSEAPKMLEAGFSPSRLAVGNESPLNEALRKLANQQTALSGPEPVTRHFAEAPSALPAENTIPAIDAVDFKKPPTAVQFPNGTAFNLQRFRNAVQQAGLDGALLYSVSESIDEETGERRYRLDVVSYLKAKDAFMHRQGLLTSNLDQLRRMNPLFLGVLGVLALIVLGLVIRMVKRRLQAKQVGSLSLTIRYYNKVEESHFVVRLVPLHSRFVWRYDSLFTGRWSGPMKDRFNALFRLFGLRTVLVRNPSFRFNGLQPCRHKLYITGTLKHPTTGDVIGTEESEREIDIESGQNTRLELDFEQRETYVEFKVVTLGSTRRFQDSVASITIDEKPDLFLTAALNEKVNCYLPMGDYRVRATLGEFEASETLSVTDEKPRELALRLSHKRQPDDPVKPSPGDSYDPLRYREKS